MTVSIVPFVPTPQVAFRFAPVLDGVTYTAIVTWNIFGQRFYLNLYDPDQVRVLTTAMVGSPLGQNISLVEGYFATLLVYRAPSRQFEIGAAAELLG
ncbi:MAG: hypothetical protein ACEQSH_00135 [Bacteroidia bacterium]